MKCTIWPMRWQNKTEVFKKSKKKNQDKNQTSEVKYDQLHSMFKSHGEKMLKLCTTAKAFHDRVTKKKNQTNNKKNLPVPKQAECLLKRMQNGSVWFCWINIQSGNSRDHLLDFENECCPVLVLYTTPAAQQSRVFVVFLVSRFVKCFNWWKFRTVKYAKASLK